MKSAEGQAVVQLHASIGYVQRVHRDGVFLCEGFADGEIKRSMAGQIRSWILRVRHAEQSVREARAVVDVCRGGDLPRKSAVVTDVQGVSLVMVYGC